MKKDIFYLRKGDEFIELIKLLKIKEIAQTGGHAKLIVEEGLVKVNGVQEFRKRNKLRAGFCVEVNDISIEIKEAE